MKTGKFINVDCRCGYRLFRYFKAGKGRLIKCFLHKINEDNVGMVEMDTFHKPLCPNCSKELGIIMMIKGKPALKLNQGTIKSIRL